MQLNSYNFLQVKLSFLSIDSILSKSALEVAHKHYEASLQNSTQNRRQTHAAIQEKLNSLLVHIRLYEKGLKVCKLF